MKNSHTELPLVREFLFDLPDELIARYPPETRDASRMLVIDRTDCDLKDRSIQDITDFLKPGDVLVRNTTRVSLRNVPMIRVTDGTPDESMKPVVLFLEETPDGNWITLLRARKKLKAGQILKPLKPYGDLYFTYKGKSEKLYPKLCEGLPGSVLSPSIKFESELFFDHCGTVPLPPYIGRKSEELDKVRYRTVYENAASAQKTSAAAPTAGFHFTPELIKKIEDMGALWADVELHIGYGTFSPLTEENIRKKELHRETYVISEKTASLLNSMIQLRNMHPAGSENPRIIAVGTTALRALEDNYRRNSGQFTAGFFETRLFLHPPDEIRSVQGLLTNFHLPGSSLIMLTACLAGTELIKKAYSHAIDKKYRFFSYGDCSLII